MLLLVRKCNTSNWKYSKNVSFAVLQKIQLLLLTVIDTRIVHFFTVNCFPIYLDKNLYMGIVSVLYTLTIYTFIKYTLENTYRVCKFNFLSLVVKKCTILMSITVNNNIRIFCNFAQKSMFCNYSET